MGGGKPNLEGGNRSRGGDATVQNTQLNTKCENSAQKQRDLLQSAIQEGNKQCVPKKDRGRGKPWMTEHILQLREESRKWKDRDRDKACRIMKGERMGEMCKEIEELNKRDKGIVYERITRISGKQRPRKSCTIRIKDGKVLMEGICERST